MIASADGCRRRSSTSFGANPPNSARRTSISSALQFAGDLFAESSFRGLKRVVDVSGDGANNQGPAVAEIRDEIVAQGITINGLPLMTSGGTPSVFDIDDLDVYYTNCVIGGPGAFMIPVNDWSQFPEAVRRKLVLELASAPPMREARRPPVVKVAGRRRTTTARSARRCGATAAGCGTCGEGDRFTSPLGRRCLTAGPDGG